MRFGPRCHAAFRSCHAQATSKPAVDPSVVATTGMALICRPLAAGAYPQWFRLVFDI
jgi:hypothetical protein